MSKSVLLALSLPLGLLVGCKANEPTFEEIPYPVMTLGQASLEYGEAAWGGSVERTVLLSNEGGMPMGVESIIIGDADAGTSSFTVAYDPCAIECPEAAAGDTAAAAKSIDVDTGEAPGTDTGTTGTDTAGGTCGGGDDTALFVLDPGCHVPVTVTYTPVSQGEAYDALVVTSVGLALTAEEEDEGVDLPAYKEDPIRTQQVVYLHGESNYAQGAVIVRPRSFDFGYVHPDAADAEAPARIQIGNVGDGDVTIIGAELSSSCDEASFVLERRFEDNFVLGGDATTLAEVTFTPTDTNLDRIGVIQAQVHDLIGKYRLAVGELEQQSGVVAEQDRKVRELSAQIKALRSENEELRLLLSFNGDAAARAKLAKQLQSWSKEINQVISKLQP